jgi:hypothetical protein
MNRSQLGLVARFAFALAAVAALAAPSALAAPATTAQCGQVITRDTKLAADIVCASETDSAIFIGADDITLDLNGHALIGPGAGEVDESNGVTTDASRTGLVVKDGRITGFSQGVNFGPARRVAATDSLFKNLTIDGELNITVSGDRNRFERNDLTGGFTALRLDGSNLIVDRNDTRGGDPTVIEVEGSNPTVTRNTAVCGRYGAGGISVQSPDTGLVARNFATGCWGTAIIAGGVTIKQNTATDNGIGILGGPGSVDGGGNSASGNEEADCVNVLCK